MCPSKKNNRSSVYTTVLYSLLFTWKPWIVFSRLINLIRGLRVNIKSRADRGHSCLVPLHVFVGLENVLFI